MPAKLLEGSPIAVKIKEQLKKEILDFDKGLVLASIQVGENSGSVSYIKAQTKAAEDLGIEYRPYKLGDATTKVELTALITKLNSDRSVNGIIVQMPLPKQIDYKGVLSFIDPLKDIEGVNPENLGKIILAKSKILPPTVAAVMELLETAKVKLYGKEVVVVGASEIVGKPLSMLLLNKFATTTVCHIATFESGKLSSHVNRAEVLVVAVGKAGVIKGDWIKEGAVVIDVGINRINDKIVGDVDFVTAASKASLITPVPGGVGPLTTAILMRNLVEAAKLQRANS
jgi:methylenetetrahydrofolate dehydrogenase (NADP+) / methenyltetrahydrofolate cyclohydrolase